MIKKYITTDEDFDFGETNQEYVELFYKENFIEHAYERLYKIKENDVVLDIGANYGSFSYSVKDSKPKHIFCIEPSNRIYEILKKNLSDVPSTIINKGISNVNSENKQLSPDIDIIYYHNGDTFSTITYKSLIEKYNITNIDFLKFDCEGAEAHIFTKENVDVIKRNVKNIAGEYHICNTQNSVNNFIEFRDNYLAELRGTDRLKVYERDGRDVTEEIFDDNFVKDFNVWWQTNNSYKGQFMVYANFNDKEVKKIPVIGAPVVNSTYWISRLIMSVDYPVENFVIINNNGRGELDIELNRLAKMKHKYIDNIKVVHMPANIGCAGAWNLIIKCYMNAPYWIIANDDVAFGPGLLEEMVNLMEEQPTVGMIHPNPGDYNLGAWDLFLIRESIVQMFGLFDENTYPAYCEDADYIMRYIHRPIHKIVGTEKSYMHGETDSKNYYATDGGSQTQKSDENLKEILKKSNELNIEYLTRKWGKDWRTVQPRVLPFMDEEKHIGTTTYDLNFVRSKYTGF